MRLFALAALLLASVGLCQAKKAVDPYIDIQYPGTGMYKGGVTLQVVGVYTPEKTGIPVVYVTNTATNKKSGPYAVSYGDGSFVSTGIAFGPGTYEIEVILTGTAASSSCMITVLPGPSAKKEDD